MGAQDLEIVRLNNGINVVIIPDTNQTDVWVGVYIRDGSRNDPPEKAGLAHLLEHMVFKGTKKLSTWKEINKFASRFPSLNAETSYEYIRFYIQGMPDQLESMIFFLSEVILRPRAIEHPIKNDLKKEKKVVLSEYFEYIDDPVEKNSDNIQKLVYKFHPLGHKIIGEPETIANIKRRDLIKRWHTTFRAENILIILYGKVSEGAALNYIKLNFKVRKRKPNKDPSSWIAPLLVRNDLRERVYFEEIPLRNFYFTLAFPTRGLRESNRFILMFISYILSSEWGSILIAELREKLGISYYINSEVVEFTDTGLFTIKGNFLPEHLVLGIRKILNILKGLTTKNIDKIFFENAKTSFITRFRLLSQSPDWIMERIYLDWIMGKELRSPESDIKIIKSIELEDIKKIASKIFNPSRMYLSIIGPFSEKISPEDITRIIKKWESSFRKTKNSRKLITNVSPNIQIDNPV
jgi:predicted Zn-dependent peptidase